MHMLIQMFVYRHTYLCMIYLWHIESLHKQTLQAHCRNTHNTCAHTYTYTKLCVHTEYRWQIDAPKPTYTMYMCAHS